MEPEDEERRRDLELTRACAAGDPAAHRAIKQRFDEELVSIVRRMGADARLAEEIVQQAWIRLLVPVPPAAARICSYSGKGRLKAWLRMVVTRVAIVALQARGAPYEALEDALDQLVASANSDPEVEYLKRLYSAEFRAAFRAAASALTARQRNILRHYFVSQLSIDQLGAMYGVYRATAFRHVQQARDALIVATRAELAARLQISPESVESVIRLIASRIDLDLSAL